MVALSPLPISAFLITYNEEANLRACLESLRFCQEIVLVDSYSSDRTLEIAREFGVRCIQRPFTGYRDQKQFALEQCCNEWVLSLDADERISEGLQRFIREQVPFTASATEGPQGYAFRRLHWFQGQLLRHGTLYPDYKLRLFRKSCGRFVGANVHEVVAVEGVVRSVPLDILHYPWRDLRQLLDKQLKYAEQVAQSRYQDGRQAQTWELLLKPPYHFLYAYLWRGGFLDGWFGLLLAWVGALSTFHKYFQLRRYSLAQVNFFSKHASWLWLLKPVQWMYALLVRLRLLLYRRGILPEGHLSVPTVSVGNLSLGGCGKTPFTLWLAEQLQVLGCQRPTILLRGYQGQARSGSLPRIVQPDSNPAEVGDEAVLMRQAAFSVVVGSDRLQAGQLAVEALNADVLLLDDGFQHLRLGRDLNILLIDCSDGQFTSLFPLGTRREPWTELRRADLIILTRSQIRPGLTRKIHQLLERYAGDIPKVELLEELAGFRRRCGAELEIPKGARVFAFCGIGNPGQFLDALRRTDLQLVDCQVYPDHHHYRADDLQKLQERFRLSEAEYLVCTAKDAVKLPPDALESLIVAQLKIVGLTGLEGGLAALLRKKLHL